MKVNVNRSGPHLGSGSAENRNIIVNVNGSGLGSGSAEMNVNVNVNVHNGSGSASVEAPIMSESVMSANQFGSRTHGRGKGHKANRSNRRIIEKFYDLEWLLYILRGTYSIGPLAMICHVLHPVEEQRVIRLGFRTVRQWGMQRTRAGTHTPQKYAKLENTENTGLKCIKEYGKYQKISKNKNCSWSHDSGSHLDFGRVAI